MNKIFIRYTVGIFISLVFMALGYFALAQTSFVNEWSFIDYSVFTLGSSLLIAGAISFFVVSAASLESLQNSQLYSSN